MLKNKEIWKKEEEEEYQEKLEANKDKLEIKLLNKLLIFLECLNKKTRNLSLRIKKMRLTNQNKTQIRQVRLK